MTLGMKVIENIVVKGENAGYKNFSFSRNVSCPFRDKLYGLSHI